MKLTALRRYLPPHAATSGVELRAMQLRCPHAQVCDIANGGMRPLICARSVPP
ncbi:hypothetical protein XMIN_1197 [Xanthomonas citri pv. mangiferaeindicae LMG 941]|nr:hypothetical protein XMIN_1197 [Xanthomonas citri pv. mangiferaeindicae LMG 941]